MQTSAEEIHALQRAAELEAPLSAVEARLAALGQALLARDAVAIDTEAAELHRALAAAVDHFGRAAREGGVPAPLRERLVTVSGRVASQREALARATASLDRAIDVLWPAAPSAGVYSASGTAERGAGSGHLRA
jgi:hypothetical protein